MIGFLEKLAGWIEALSSFTGRAISYLTLVMVLVTCGVVGARYLLGAGSIGLQESVMYMHGIVFMLGIAFTLKENAHVRVDVLYEKFSPKTRAWIDLIGSLVFLLPVAVFIGVSSLDYVALAWSLKESSGQPGGLPGVYLLKMLIPLMAGLLALQGVAEIIRNGLIVSGKAPDS